MTIEVKQICDGCGFERVLELRNAHGPIDIGNASKSGGWREPRQDKHLCSPCIDRALSAGENQKAAADATG